LLIKQFLKLTIPKVRLLTAGGIQTIIKYQLDIDTCVCL